MATQRKIVIIQVMVRAFKSVFGEIDGAIVPAVALSNSSGVVANLLAYGATLQALHLPDRLGEPADIILGYPSLEGYLGSSEYCGATVGRYANRLANGRFRLGATTFETPTNEGPNALHSGPCGLDRQVWDVVDIGEGEKGRCLLRHVSPAGHQGYPGELTIHALYALDEANNLTIEYSATADASTIVNITNHAYWNLSGDPLADALDHRLTLHALAFTPVDNALLPTGEIRAVDGSAFDFRRPRTIGDMMREAAGEQIEIGMGYDHNFVVAERAGEHAQPVALLAHPGSGRAIELWSNQPGLQFYSGNKLGGGLPGKAGLPHRPRQAVALEPQCLPDTPNRPAFGSARLEPGETYRHKIVVRLLSG